MLVLLFFVLPVYRICNQTTATGYPAALIDRLSGLILLTVATLVVLAEATGAREAFVAAGAGAVAFLALALPRLRWSRQVFVAVGLVLVLSALATRPDWPALTERALKSAAFIAAFFTALAWLRSAAATSPTIERCGRFLAEQPPGRRYLALTAGGHLFGLVLLYGAISLLGSLAESSARREPNEEIRTIRTRRMLLAIQRGFVSTLGWSPMTFSMAVCTAVVPGSSWAGAVGLCAVGSLILAALGWGMDTAFKPKLSAPAPPRTAPDGSWADMTPLLVLLALLMAGVAAIHLTADLRVAIAVMIIVPVISLSWTAIQARGSGRDPLLRTARSARRFVLDELPEYRSELVLLMMAGFIGTLGSGLLGPLVAGSGIDLHAVPAWALLVTLMWVVPITGQLGMNPILSVSLLAPLLPGAEALGISPNVIVVALTAGWALSGASSPFTATTLMVGSIGRVSALEVGWKWNGAYTLIGGILLSLWVAAVSGF